MSLRLPTVVVAAAVAVGSVADAVVENCYWSVVLWLPVWCCWT